MKGQMFTEWPHVRMIKRNPRLSKDHLDSMEAGRLSMDTHHYLWKQSICASIGAPDYYCPLSGKGHLNWDYIKAGIDEMINGPRPHGNGDAQALDLYRRNKIDMVPVTEHFFEDVETVPNLLDIDPARRRLWLPLQSGGHSADGWLSNREPRFSWIIEEHYRTRSTMDNARLRVSAGGVAGAYDAKVIRKAMAREIIGEILRSPMPLTLEDLTGI